jgi:hypothetical protein
LWAAEAHGGEGAVIALPMGGGGGACVDLSRGTSTCRKGKRTDSSVKKALAGLKAAIKEHVPAALKQVEVDLAKHADDLRQRSGGGTDLDSLRAEALTALETADPEALASAMKTVNAALLKKGRPIGVSELSGPSELLDLLRAPAPPKAPAPFVALQAGAPLAVLHAVDHAAAERIALRVLALDAPLELQVSAIEALATSRDAAATPLLVRALARTRDGGGQIRDTAIARAVAACRAEGIGAGVLALLTPDLEKVSGINHPLYDYAMRVWGVLAAQHHAPGHEALRRLRASHPSDFVRAKLDQWLILKGQPPPPGWSWR